jgi:hypothetical protein
MKAHHLSNFDEIIAQLPAEHVVCATSVIATQVAKGPPYDKNTEIVGNTYTLGVFSVPGTDQVKVAH